MENIQVLFFDVYGTIVDWRGGVARTLDRFLARNAIAGLDGPRLADAWAARYAVTSEEIRSGRRPFVPFDAINRENLAALLREAGVDAPPEELDRLNRAWGRLDPWPDALEGLARLRRSYLITPFSTGNTRLLVDMAKSAGLPWDTILGADALGVYKPDPLAYLRAAGLLGIRPEQAMLVAAHNDDLTAARAQGMKTAFLPRPREHGPDQTTDLAPSEAWDILAEDLIDLARILVPGDQATTGGA